MLPGKKISVSEITSMLRRHIWRLIAVPVVTLFAALIYSAQVPDMYQAEVSIAIIPQRVPDAFVKSTVTLRTEERLDAITAQVLNRTFLEQLIGEFNLYQNERRRLPMEDVVEKMRLEVETIRERARLGPRGPEPLHAFKVRYTYPDAQLVARVAQRVASAFVEQNARDRSGLAQATNEFLETQLSEARKRLELHEGRLEEFRKKHGNELPTQASSNMQGIQNAQMQVQALVESGARDRDRRLMLERLVSEVEAEPLVMPAIPVSAAGQPGAAPAGATAAQQLAAARQTMAQLEAKYQPQHPDIVRLKRVIIDLEAKTEKETGTEAKTPAVVSSTPEDVARRARVRDMRAEIESLGRQVQFKESEERRLRGIIAEYQRRIEAVPGVEAEWSALTRDYETNKAAYEDLLTKSELSKVSVDLERRQIGEQFRILDNARVPGRPSSPVRMQISAIGLGAGVVLGLLLSALLELRKDVYRNEADIVQVLSLPVLALVPLVPTAAETRRRKHRTLFAVAATFAATVAMGVVFWTMRLWSYLA